METKWWAKLQYLSFISFCYWTTSSRLEVGLTNLKAEDSGGTQRFAKEKEYRKGPNEKEL